MKKGGLRVVAVVLTAVLVSGCASLFGPAVDEDAYRLLEGTWLVETRPEGWANHRISVGADKSYTGYWLHPDYLPQETLGVTGAIVRCDGASVRTRVNESLLAGQEPGSRTQHPWRGDVQGGPSCRPASPPIPLSATSYGHGRRFSRLWTDERG